LLRLTVPLDIAGMAKAFAEMVEANGLREGGLRLTLTRGPAPRGLLPPSGARPTLMITGFGPLPAGKPACVILASQIRRDAHSPLSRIKSLNYLPNILARLEAEEAGADDAILLNQTGFVAEATAGNIFLKRQGKWLTPFVADGAMPGIRREKLLEAGRVIEARIELVWLQSAEALCIGNVLSVRAVERVGQTPIPVGELAELILE
jgi:branched-chain amino acid aminotransferase